MDSFGDVNLDEFLREIAEISVGTAILGLRRVNIERRRISEENSHLAPIIDAVLDQVEALAEPASAFVGSMVAGIGDAMPGTRGEQVTEAGRLLATMGPELLRLSGLTKRD